MEVWMKVVSLGGFGMEGRRIQKNSWLYLVFIQLFYKGLKFLFLTEMAGWLLCKIFLHW